VTRGSIRFFAFPQSLEATGRFSPRWAGSSPCGSGCLTSEIEWAAHQFPHQKGRLRRGPPPPRPARWSAARKAAAPNATMAAWW